MLRIECQKSNLGTFTIRVQPRNYMLYIRIGDRWYIDADNAIPDKVVKEASVILRKNQYNTDQSIIDALCENPIIKTWLVEEK